MRCRGEKVSATFTLAIVATEVRKRKKIKLDPQPSFQSVKQKHTKNGFVKIVRPQIHTTS